MKLLIYYLSIYFNTLQQVIEIFSTSIVVLVPLHCGEALQVPMQWLKGTDTFPFESQEALHEDPAIQAHPLQLPLQLQDGE